MSKKISPIIKPDELIRLKQSKDIVLVDVRTGPGIKEKYAAAHLEGALFVDVDSQLADIKQDAADGGRHPLPAPAQFAALLTALGITPQTHVIVYDDKSGANAAARLWWMLRAVGHTLVQVIDGGFDAAVNAGFPVSSKQEIPATTGHYTASAWKLPLSGINEVEKVANDKGYLVIDVRDKYRYDGDSEPIDLVAGHIPGAINIPFTGNLDVNGFYLPEDELRKKYLQELDGRPADHVIVHCGSGVTACHTLLAMDYAGLEIPKLYVGSWGEWSRTDRPIATKAQM